MLVLAGVHKCFGATRAVDGVSLEVEPGKLCVIVGPSACGKTTLLRLIAGLETPDRGVVRMNAEDWTELPPQKRDVALVFQNYALYPHRTVRGNIEYPLRLRHIAAAERRVRVERIAALLGLSSILDRTPRNLSGGEAQRVALARGLVREPACFLLDEPLSNLDAQMRATARAEIKRLQRHLKVTTVYVTHDQEDALALADCIAVMNEGRIVQSGTPQELFSRPATTFVASFLGKPPMNLLDAVVRERKGGGAVIELTRQAPADSALSLPVPVSLRAGQQVLVGLQPGELEITSPASVSDREPPFGQVPARLELVEGIEPQVTLHCATAFGTILVRSTTQPVSDECVLRFDLSTVHLFDVASGKRIAIDGSE